MPVAVNVDTAKVVLTGTTALVMDNIEHSDPDDPIAQEIKKITDKGKDMTEEDRHRKDWLAYHASLYVQDTGDSRRIVIPWKNINRALRTGAFRIGGVSASGKADGGIACAVLDFPLDYKGHFQAANNEIVCASQVYKTKEAAINGAYVMKEKAGAAKVYDYTGESA